MSLRIFALPIILLWLLHMAKSSRPDCSKETYDSCIRIADPLIREARLIFPDNMADITRVCDTWNSFVDCLKGYTERCFTEQQRRQFNKAVENPIESVHQMCTQPEYRAEYMLYAGCIKSTVTERKHCGIQYNLLVDQVSQGDIISKSTLCCSHDQFKQCVARETRSTCDRGLSDGPASKFSIQIIDKALSFLQDQCYNYIPNSDDCSIVSTDPLTISTSSSEVYPWSTIQDNMAAKEVISSRVTPPRLQTSSWLPSSSISIQNSGSTGTQMLGSRTRPASYGRSGGWSEQSISTQSGNTIQMNPEVTSQAARPDWATISSWQPDASSNSAVGSQQDEAMKSSTRWYSVSGMPSIDEPNQQGLSKPENNAARRDQGVVLMVAITCAMLFAGGQY